MSYLNLQEAAALLRVRPAAIRQRMARGVFTRGVHYFHPRGARGVLFKRAALEDWVESPGGDELEVKSSVNLPPVRMARGYVMGAR